MTTIEGEEDRKPTGRPRRFGRGRINTTVRFTPERYAKLKAAADAAGRSVSEQNEFLIEDHERLVKDEEMVVKMYSGFDELLTKIDRFQRALENERAALREKATMDVQYVVDRLEKARASDNERIAEIVAIAVAKTLGRSQP